MSFLLTDLDTQHNVYTHRIDGKLGIRFSKQNSEEKENIGNWLSCKFSLPNQVSTPHRNAVFKTELPPPFLDFQRLNSFGEFRKFQNFKKGRDCWEGGGSEVHSQDTKPVPIPS